MTKPRASEIMVSRALSRSIATCEAADLTVEESYDFEAVTAEVADMALNLAVEESALIQSS